MDYSIRSLRKHGAGNKKEKNSVRKEHELNDRQTLIMQTVRQAYESKGSKAIELKSLLDLVNKRGTEDVTMDELRNLLKYYAKLQVVFLNEEDQVVFL